MVYTIQNIKKKFWNNKWLADVIVIDNQGNQLSGAVWEEQKDGSKFPNFHSIDVGSIIDVKAWTNPTSGKVSFFPNTARKTQNQANNTGISHQAQPKTFSKEEMIQNQKDEGIKMSSTIRMAVDIVTAGDTTGKTPENIKKEILEWRYWLVEKWGQMSPVKVTGTNMDYPENNIEEPPF